MKILNCSPLREKGIQKIMDAFPQHEFILSDTNASQEQIDEADIIFGNPNIHRKLNSEKMKAILLDSAGSDQYCAKGILHPNTKLANASGSYGKAISEQTIGMIIALCKNFKQYSFHMKNHAWNKLSTGKEIYGSKVCIVGYGDLGYHTAKRLKAFDCHITAVKRRVEKNLPCVDRVIGMNLLNEALAESDIVILSLPQNQSTIHLFDKERLLKIKENAILVNIGRGSAIVTEDLIDVLKTGHFYGVALDVVDPEPLPETSALWDMENVFITPHSSGGFVWESVQDYYADLVIRNIKHLEVGEELENEVDPVTGYRKKVVYE